MFSTATPEEILDLAIEVSRKDDDARRDVLDRLPAPLYVTDAKGRLTYFNQACVDFSGRTPVVGRDSWCVTWKLYSEDGSFLPHDRCPMAIAIRQRKPVRGMVALAERPDGSRVAFRAYPTPLHDDTGAMVGAINLLVDITGQIRADELRAEALHCRRLAETNTDEKTVRTLELIASDCEQQARDLETAKRC